MNQRAQELHLDPLDLRPQPLEPVAGRDVQVVEASGDLQVAQLAPRHRFDRLEASHPAAPGQRLGVGVAGGDDHAAVATQRVNDARRDA